MKKRLPLVVFFAAIIGINSFGQQTGDTPKIGLVLSGGGAKGLAHIGVLQTLEEAGIKPDYITGTSMGSIIGGLYAMGYSADKIAEIALTQDWNYLMEDKIPRSNLNITEKDDQNKYLASVTFNENKIAFPLGLNSGQHITNFLTRLTTPVADISDFDELNIPFRCMATNVETGEAEVLKNGYLPDAMRASMAIPSVFTPHEINGKLYVDGGVVNNLPVQQVIDMGADIVIASYTGYLPENYEELRSPFDVIEQTMFFTSYKHAMEQKEKCDFYIVPDLQKFTGYNYKNVDSIIAKGRNEAQKYLKDLQALAQNTVKEPQESKGKKTINVPDTVPINGIQVTGIENIPEKVVIAKLNLDIPDEIPFNSIQNSINNLYGTRYFHKITYRIEKDTTGNDLILHLKERNDHIARAGIQYNNDFKASILLNLTMRNILLNGSKLKIDASLGANPQVQIEYRFSAFWNPYYTLGIKGRGDYIDFYDYNNNTRVNTYKINSERLQLYNEASPNNNLAFRIGGEVRYDHINLKQGIVDETLPNYLTYSAYTEIIQDSYNHRFYPTSGTSTHLELRLLRYKNQDDLLELGQVLYFKAGQTISMGKKFTIEPKQFLNIAYGKDVPQTYYSALGGDNYYPRPIEPFSGYRYGQLVAPMTMVLKLHLRHELFDNHYLILRNNLAKLANYINDLVNDKNIHWGMGLTYAYDSFIGPVELTAMTHDYQQYYGSISIGFTF